VFVAGFPRQQAGEATPATLREVEPQVVRHGAVAVGPFGSAHQLADIGDLGSVELPLDDEGAHVRQATPCGVAT
jgi:hypothetical protein